MTTKLHLRMGLTRVRKPRYASEAGFVEAVNAQLRILEEELQDIFDQIENVSPEIMLEALQPTFEKSQRRCPVDTGRLVESGYLEDVSSPARPKVEMGYAKGGDPEYAVYVHEALDVYHQPPTEAKFLERPMMEDLDQIRRRLEQGYSQFMGVAGQTPYEF